MIFQKLLFLLLINLHNTGSFDLNLPGCTVLAAFCKSDPSCLDENVFLQKCLSKNSLTKVSKPSTEHQNTKTDLWNNLVNANYPVDSQSYFVDQNTELNPNQVTLERQSEEEISAQEALQAQISTDIRKLTLEIKKRKNERNRVRHLFELYQQESIRESKVFKLKEHLDKLSKLEQEHNIEQKDSNYFDTETDNHGNLINDAFGVIQSLVKQLKQRELRLKSNYINAASEINLNKNHSANTIKEPVAQSQEDIELFSNKKLATKKDLVNTKDLKFLKLKDETLQRIFSLDRDEEALPVKDNQDQLSLLKRDNIEKEEDRGYLTVTTNQRLNTTTAKELGSQLQYSLWNIKAENHPILIPINILSESSVVFHLVINPKWSNSQDNSSTVAQRIISDNQLIEDIKHAISIDIISAYVSSSAPVASKLDVSKKDWNRLTIFTAIIGGCTLALILIASIVYTIKRHSKETPVGFKKIEAVQDYQELCRTQMSVVNSTDNETEKDGNMKGNWHDDSFPYNMDITTGHVILSYMEDHLKNEDRLNKEWEALCSYKAEDVTTKSASDPKNSSKNRYRDVLPFDHSRIKLHEISNTFHSDYINASFISDVNPRQPEYIATQAPLDNTVADFWQMVWEQGVAVIVNLTKLSDVGLPQCHRYWPVNGSQVFHIYEVHLISEHIWCDDYLVRSLYLKNLQTAETRTVTQFHYLTWPDLSVPHSPKPLLEFRRKVNKCYRGHGCPIIVHCNNGVGRTGTYILLDMVLNKMIKGAKEMDIAASLEHIRDQRSDMVKTKGQFEFSLTAVAEEVTTILSSIPK